jgi:hypothetical protein
LTAAVAAAAVAVTEAVAAAVAWMGGSATGAGKVAACVVEGAILFSVMMPRNRSGVGGLPRHGKKQKGGFQITSAK